MSHYVPYKQIAEQLELQVGDIVYVASNIVRLSIHAKRNNESFEPGGFIDSLQNRIGQEGTLIFPAFNFSVNKQAGFDLKKTAPTTGTLPLCAFHRDDFIRTAHPLHSFLVWGKHATKLAEMSNITSFGEDSPFAFLNYSNAKMLAIDLDLQHSYSNAHYVEEAQQVDYRKWQTYSFNYMQNGKSENRVYKLFQKKIGWVNDLSKLTDVVNEKKMANTTIINNVDFTISLLGDIDKELALLYVNVGNKALAQFSLPVFAKQLFKKLLGKPTL